VCSRCTWYVTNLFMNQYSGCHLSRDWDKYSNSGPIMMKFLLDILTVSGGAELTEYFSMHRDRLDISIESIGREGQCTIYNSYWRLRFLW
jgi:hypothetical protein